MPRKLKRPAKRTQEPDRLDTVFDRVREGLVKNWRLFTFGLVLVALAVSAVVLWSRGLERKEQHASFLLSQGVTKLKDADGLSGEEATSTYTEALNVLKDLVTDYGSTESGALGVFYLGRCLTRLGRYGEAIQEYERFLSTAGSNQLYRLLVLQSLGFAYRNEKNYERALACFRELAEMEPVFLGGEPILALGRTYEEMGQEQEALGAYRDFLEKYPDSTESNRIKRRVALLERQVR